MIWVRKNRDQLEGAHGLADTALFRMISPSDNIWNTTNISRQQDWERQQKSEQPNAEWRILICSLSPEQDPWEEIDVQYATILYDLLKKYTHFVTHLEKTTSSHNSHSRVMTLEM